LYHFDTGVYYEHCFTHNHSEYSRKLHLTTAEHGQLRSLITQHPTSGPLALLVGAPTLDGPGKSAAEISTVLANQDRLKAERRVIKSGQSSGGNRFIAEFAKFCEDHPGFIISSQFNTATVVSMQSKLMASQLIKDAILPDQSEALNGLISDAAHGFWLERNYLLIVSLVYSPLLHCWVPGIFSFSNGASTEHYEQHFGALFASIAHEAQQRSITLEFHHFSGVSHKAVFYMTHLNKI
jgi:hypothetical protein